MFIFSFLQPFIGVPGLEVSCELNKGILAHYMKGRILRDGSLCII